MAGENWTPTQKVLYTSLVPFALIVGAALLLASLRVDGKSTSEAQARPAASQQTQALDARDSMRDQFRQCLRDLDADFRRPQFRSRFSPRPNVKKIQEAYAICQSLLQGDGAPPAAPRAPAAPPIA